MNQLTKLAFFGNMRKGQQMGNEWVEQVNAAPQLGQAELHELIQKLQKEYGFKSPYLQVDSPTLSAYAHKNVLEDLMNKGLYFGKIHEEGLTQSVPQKEILLHEVGHSLDPDVYKDISKGQGLANKVAPNMGFYGGLAGASAGVGAGAEKDEQKKDTSRAVGFGLAGATTGASVGLAHKGGKLIEGAEDRANDFVKRYLQDELGSVEKAQEAFHHSPLPLGRETYRNQTGLFRRNALINGVVGAGVGAGVGALIANHHKKNQSQV